MDTFVLLIISWVGLTFSSIHRAHSGNDAKLEKKDLIWVVPTAVSGTLFTLDWVTSHWSSISIPFPQGNATTSQYITIRIPRVFPQLPSPIAMILLVVFVGLLITSATFSIYNELVPKKLGPLGPGDKDKQLAREFAREKQKLEEVDRDRKDIYEAIKEWIQPPDTRLQIIGGQQEPLYLAERLPKRAQKIDACLSRNYPEIWADLQEFRSKYTELMSLDTTIPEEFRERINGVENVKLYLLNARKDSIRGQLLARQRQLVQRINLEIVEKHDTELKY